MPDAALDTAPFVDVDAMLPAADMVGEDADDAEEDELPELTADVMSDGTVRLPSPAPKLTEPSEFKVLGLAAKNVRVYMTFSRT